MKISDYIANVLRAEGIDTVFGYQGSNVTHIIDSLTRLDGIQYIQNYHEQGAAFAANAYAQVKGTIGCALSSSGPGAINMISGIANAWFDSIPCLFLTGQLNTKALRKNRNHRQEGFQEFDIVTTVSEFTKYAVTILDPAEIRYHIEKALFLIKTGRMGPALLDIPHNVQTADVDIESAKKFLGTKEHENLSAMQCRVKSYQAKDAFALLKAAKRPLLLVGGGARILKKSDALSRLLERFDLPVVASLNGLDILSHDNRRFIGFIGSYGNRYANLAIKESDLLLVLGSRLDARQTGDFPDVFAKDAKIIHVDIDSEELGHNLAADVAVNCCCLDFSEHLLDISEDYKTDNSGWIDHLHNLKADYPIFSSDDEKTVPNEILRRASEFFEKEDVVTGDVGQNQMWTAQSVLLKDDMRLLNSGGLGSMGYALPAAIGASFANRSAKAFCVAGDGGIQMNIQELGVVAREHLPIKIMVMNNQSLGLIRTYQTIVFGSCPGSVDGFTSPDYALLAKSYGIGYAVIATPEDLKKNAALFENREPVLFEVKLAPNTEVHPEPAYQKPYYIQSPLLEEDR